MLEQAIREATELGADAVRTQAQAELGIVEHERGDIAAAEAWNRAALEGFVALGDARGEGRVLGSLAIGLHERGEADEAVAAYEDALRRLRAAGDERSVGIFLSNLGDLHLEQGRLAAARQRYEQAAALLLGVGDARIAAIVTGNLGTVHQDEGDLDAAAARRREAAQTLGQLGDRRMEAVFTGYLGAARHAVGALEEAARCYETAQRQLAMAGDRRFEALFGALLGVTQASAGDLASAGRAPDAAAIADDLSDTDLSAVVSCHRGHLALASGDREAAEGGLARSEGAPQHDDLRFAVRLLQTALDPSVSPWAPADGRALTATADASVITCPDGEIVDLTRKPTLRRVAAALLAARRDDPGATLELDAMLEAGWPGQVAVGRSGANRVYVAVATLRKLGLRDVLVSAEEGYLLDPAVALQTLDAGADGPA